MSSGHCGRRSGKRTLLGRRKEGLMFFCWALFDIGIAKGDAGVQVPFKVIQGHRGRYQSKARMPLPISD